MADTGATSPGTLASVEDGGARTHWGTPSNAASSNDSRTATGFTNQGSKFLRATNFGFSIPSGATIDGVLVEIEKRQVFGNGNARDNDVRLVKAGTPSGDNKGDTSTNWPSSDSYISYPSSGASTDLWGTTLSDTDVNNSGFGVQIRFDSVAGGFVDGQVDHIRITVYYTEAAAGGITNLTQSILLKPNLIGGALIQ